MANDVERTLQTKDGNFRVLIIREDYPENPRTLTDEPVYFEDYSREYTLMEREDREYQCHSLEDRACKLLAEYGDAKKIIDLLIENGKHLTDGKKVCKNALEYNRESKEWDLLEAKRVFNDTNTYWQTINSFDCKKAELPEYIYEIAESLTESSLEYICGLDLMPNIKIATYKFGYYGGLQVWDGLDFAGDGLCWIIKDEFVKYTGYTEEQWQTDKLSENWLIKELKAWADNEVFGYKTEKKVEYKVEKECISENRETENYNQTEWEEIDSCWGFYGELDEKQTEWILGEAGYKMAELKDVNE